MIFMAWAFELIVVTASLLFLLVSGMWASIAIGLLGTTYLYFSVGANGLKALGLIAWGSVNSFPLAAIPLFILMAEILLKSGVADRV